MSRPPITKEALRSELARFGVAAAELNTARQLLDRAKFNPNGSAQAAAVATYQRAERGYFESAAILSGITAEFLTQEPPAAPPEG